MVAVTLYQNGDPVNEEVLNVPIIQIRDFINTVESTLYGADGDDSGIGAWDTRLTSIESQLDGTSGSLVSIDTTGITDGQFIKWSGDEATGSWVKTTLADAGIVSIDTSSFAGGEYLTWDNGSSAWVSDANVVSIASPGTDEYLKWNGSAWVTGAITQDANVVSIDTTGASLDTFLHWNGASWELVSAYNTVGQHGILSNSGTTSDNTNTFINHINGNTVKSANNISGTNGITVRSSSGSIQIDTTEPTNSTRGSIKLIDATKLNNPVQSRTSVDGKTYAIQLNSAGSAVVNVPWVDTKQTVAIDSTNTDRFITFVNSTTGDQTASSNANLKYNPGTNTLSVTNLAVSGTTSGVISQSDADTRYVNVTGDTMTGSLTVNGLSSTGSLAISTDAVLYSSGIFSTKADVKIYGHTSTQRDFKLIKGDLTSEIFTVDLITGAPKAMSNQPTPQLSPIATQHDLDNFVVSMGMNDLTDVSAASPTTGDLLSWNGTAWVATTVIDGGTFTGA